MLSNSQLLPAPGSPYSSTEAELTVSPHDADKTPEVTIILRTRWISVSDRATARGALTASLVIMQGRGEVALELWDAGKPMDTGLNE